MLLACPPEFPPDVGAELLVPLELLEQPATATPKVAATAATATMRRKRAFMSVLTLLVVGGGRSGGGLA